MVERHVEDVGVGGSIPSQATKFMEFAFSLYLDSIVWDVYYFKKDGKPGTLAFRKCPDGRFEVGLFRTGRLSPDEVKTKLMPG